MLWKVSTHSKSEKQTKCQDALGKAQKVKQQSHAVLCCCTNPWCTRILKKYCKGIAEWKSSKKMTRDFFLKMGWLLYKDQQNGIPPVVWPKITFILFFCSWQRMTACVRSHLECWHCYLIIIFVCVMPNC